jgi:hypothetical protein
MFGTLGVKRLSDRTGECQKPPRDSESNRRAYVVPDSGTWQPSHRRTLSSGCVLPVLLQQRKLFKIGRYCQANNRCNELYHAGETIMMRLMHSYLSLTASTGSGLRRRVKSSVNF